MIIKLMGVLKLHGYARHFMKHNGPSPQIKIVILVFVFFLYVSVGGGGTFSHWFENPTTFSTKGNFRVL